MYGEIGARIVIVDGLDKQDLNGKHGVIQSRIYFFPEDPEWADLSTPVILMDDGTELTGLDCWWMEEQDYVNRFMVQN